MRPLADPVLSAVFLCGFIGLLCGLILILGFAERLIDGWCDWCERRELRRPIAPNAHFPRPLIFDQGRQPHA